MTYTEISLSACDLVLYSVKHLSNLSRFKSRTLYVGESFENQIEFF